MLYSCTHMATVGVKGLTTWCRRDTVTSLVTPCIEFFLHNLSCDDRLKLYSHKLPGVGGGLGQRL